METSGRVTVFHKDMSIIAALGLHPDVRVVFETHGMACSTCIGASMESIEAGAIMHRVEPDEIVAALNTLLPDLQAPDGKGRGEV